jgi:hypothetical protein
LGHIVGQVGVRLRASATPILVVGLVWLLGCGADESPTAGSTSPAVSPPSGTTPAIGSEVDGETLEACINAAGTDVQARLRSEARFRAEAFVEATADTEFFVWDVNLYVFQSKQAAAQARPSVDAALKSELGKAAVRGNVVVSGLDQVNRGMPAFVRDVVGACLPPE